MTTDQTASFLVHADSKVGKTTLGSTAPAPRLILDAEGGTKFLPLQKIFWNPLTEEPPKYDGTWDTCIVIVRDYDTIVKTYAWLQFGQHDFVSVIIDSITEVQRRCKANLVGTEAMQIQHWGQLLSHMEMLIRDYRDLTLHPTKPIRCAVFIAETRLTDGKWKPYVQGQLAVSLPYLMDVIGYLFVQEVPNPDPTQPAHMMRRLLVTPHPLYEAGERVQGRLGPAVDEPHIEKMMAMIYPTDGGQASG